MILFHRWVFFCLCSKMFIPSLFSWPPLSWMIRHSHFGGKIKAMNSPCLLLMLLKFKVGYIMMYDVQSWLVFSSKMNYFILSLTFRSAHVLALICGYFTLEWWLDSKSAIIKNDPPGPLSVCDQAWYKLDRFNQISMYSKCIFQILHSLVPLAFYLNCFLFW